MRHYAFFLALVFVSGCLGLIASCRNVTVLQEIRIPYSDLESYEIREPYLIYLKHGVVESNITRVKQDNKTLARAIVKLKNTDTEEGWFTVIFKFSDGTLANGRRLVKPGEIYTFTFVHETPEDVNGSVEFSQSDPVTRYNTRTNYRNVTKNRTETGNVTKRICE